MRSTSIFVGITSVLGLVVSAILSFVFVFVVHWAILAVGLPVWIATLTTVVLAGLYALVFLSIVAALFFGVAAFKNL